MRRLIIALVAVAAALVAAAPAGAAPAGNPFRSDTQAARYLEGAYPGGSAYCLNGYYSRHEQRTRRHQRQGVRDRRGVDLFRTFSCSLTVQVGEDWETRNLYVATRPGAWIVIADR